MTLRLLVPLIAVLTLAPTAGASAKPPARVVHAAPAGSGVACTAHRPCSIAQAKTATRGVLANQRRTGRGAAVIVALAGGTYRLGTPLVFGPEDSGVGSARVTWQPERADATPTLSGARRVTGWRLADPARRLWVADVPDGTRSRQLYLDGTRAPIAQGQPPIGLTQTETGYTATSDQLASWRNPDQLEFVFERSNGLWTEARCRVSAIAGTAITMRQPCWDYSTKRDVGLAFDYAFPSFRPNTRPTRIENAFELLHPGQWYLDERTDKLYVMGQPGQNLNATDVEMPILEALVTGEGTLDQPVRNLTFRGLDFSYATWLEPSGDSGFADVQANVRVGGYDPSGPHPSCDTADPVETCYLVRSPANVQFRAADDIVVERSRFHHLGAAAIGFSYGSHRNTIRGNRIDDVSGVGIFLGDSNDPHPADVGADDREINTDNTITNNLIRDVGAEYHSGSGILHLYARRSKVEHNEISDVPWDGIDSGAVTGQINTPEDPDRATNINSDNRIDRNIVYDFKTVLDDGGGIYLTGHQGATLRRPDGSIDTEASYAHGTQLTGNVVYNMARHYFALYDDLGSQWITWQRNAQWGSWGGNGGCAPVGHIRFVDNFAANGVGMFICPDQPIDVDYRDTHEIPDRPAGDDVPDDVLAGAGLEAPYRSLTTTQAPQVRAFEPRTGTAPAPTRVLISGSGFGPGTRVRWGDTPAAAITVVSSNFIKATAPAGTPLARVTVTSAAGSVTAPTTRRIEDSFDVPAISDDWAPQTGELSIDYERQWAFSAQALATAGALPGQTVTRHGIDFAWPSATGGAPTAVQARGQAINVTGRGSRLGFLLTGLKDVTGTGTVVYQDGTQQAFSLRAGAFDAPTDGAEVALTARLNDGYEPGCCADKAGYVYYADVPVDPRKTVRSVVLPFTTYPHMPREDDPRSNMFVFAVGLG